MGTLRKGPSVLLPWDVVGFDEQASKGGLSIVPGRTMTMLKSGKEVMWMTRLSIMEESQLSLLMKR